MYAKCMSGACAAPAARRAELGDQRAITIYACTSSVLRHETGSLWIGILGKGYGREKVVGAPGRGISVLLQ